MKILLASPRGFCAGVNMAIETLELAIELVRRADLRLSRDRPQQVRRRATSATRASCSSTTWPKCPTGATLLVLGPRRLAGDSPRGPRAAAADDRRHLPAGDQGPPRSDQYAQAGLHDRADRPRRARRSDRHDGRGARGDRAGRDRPRTSTGWRWPTSARWPISRRRRSASTMPTGSSRRLKERFPHIARPPKEDICYATQNRQEAVSRCSPTRPTWCWCWAARTARTASGWPSWPARRGVPAYLIDGRGDIDPAWFDGVDTVLVTAGASAPEVVVEECLDLAPRPLRRDGRAALDPRRERFVPAAARAAGDGRSTTKAGILNWKAELSCSTCEHDSGN